MVRFTLARRHLLLKNSYGGKRGCVCLPHVHFTCIEAAINFKQLQIACKITTQISHITVLRSSYLGVPISFDFDFMINKCHWLYQYRHCLSIISVDTIINSGNFWTFKFNLFPVTIQGAMEKKEICHLCALTGIIILFFPFILNQYM